MFAVNQHMVDFVALLGMMLSRTKAVVGLLFASSILMFLESPIELYVNSAFRIKLVLIALGGHKALVSHQLVYPQL